VEVLEKYGEDLEDALVCGLRNGVGSFVKLRAGIGLRRRGVGAS